MNKNKVLVVDDDACILEMLKSGLEAAQYEVETAGSETDAKLALSRFKPDVVLMDIGMPGVDGITLCRDIRCTPGMNDLPIIMVSAFSDGKTFHDAMLFGATDFILKPFNIADVQKKIEESLYKRGCPK